MPAFDFDAFNHEYEAANAADENSTIPAPTAPSVEYTSSITEEVKPAVVAAPAKSEVKPAVIGGDKGKAPVKSTPAKDEKAAAPATKPASK